jgi:hypothetical protein
VGRHNTMITWLPDDVRGRCIHLAALDRPPAPNTDFVIGILGYDDEKCLARSIAFAQRHTSCKSILLFTERTTRSSDADSPTPEETAADPPIPRLFSTCS